ncbi:hypothetical protein Tco_0035408, partial [Tanacetum coccineum]
AKGRRGLVSPKKRQSSFFPRKGRVVMSERVFNPTPITQFNPVTNEVLNDNVKLAVMTEDADIVKENPVSVNEKLAAIVKDPLRYSRSVKGKPADVMNKPSLGKSNVLVAKADVVKSSVDKEALVDKANDPAKVVIQSVLTQLENAPDVENSVPDVGKKSMLDGTFTSFDEKWKRFSDQVNAQFNGNEGGRGLCWEIQVKRLTYC